MHEERKAGLALMRRPQVEAVTGMACSTLYDRMANDDFPRPVRIGRRAVGWVESEVQDWIESRIAASRTVA